MIAYRAKRPPIYIQTAGFSFGLVGPSRPRVHVALERRGIRRIQHAVAEYYGLKQIEMVSQRRGRAVAWPRQVAMYLCRELTTHSLPSIGKHFGGRDHTTVMHAIRAVESRKGATPKDVKILRNILCENIGDNCQTTSNSPAEHGKEQGVNKQVESQAA